MSMILPYVLAFAVAFVTTIVLTPLVRELNRRLGMVDEPDARRINQVPIPRGGGLALMLGTVGTFFVLVRFLPDVFQQVYIAPRIVRLAMLAVAMALWGLADDRMGLPPKLKLLGQTVLSVLAWGWADVGFSDLWPQLPVALDCLITVFWIVGAVNAFNLIDGLDGLASGLAMIATIGMAGVLFFLGRAELTLWHFAFIGGLLGFLRYNYNPASVFLGDSGSMFIGFILAIMPLLSHTPNSFLVSVGVPMLAMGVPIFDTALAILRRSLRHLLFRSVANGEDEQLAGEGRVMTADKDHLHHRILRSVGLSQRKAAWVLYATALFFVAVGLVLMNLESQRAGLWLVALTVASVVIFKDIARVELYDAGRLLSHVAHDRDLGVRRRFARLAVPFYVVADIGALVAAFFLVGWIGHQGFTRTGLFLALPIRVFSTFFCLVFFRVYRTIWSRAMLSNYVRLFLACLFGAIISTVAIFYAPGTTPVLLKAKLIFFTLIPFFLMVSVRVVRDVVRDLFYAIDCARLVARKDVSRVLVYGSGLRYRAFRRELVRTASENNRIIVGLIDDDILLRGHFIGGLRVEGTIHDAPEIIVRMNVDSVVVACVMTEAWKAQVEAILAPTGVKVTFFNFKEQEL